MNSQHRLIQLLLRAWPFPRGSGRIVDRYFSQISFADPISLVRTTDGFEMSVPPNDAVGRHIYLTGEFDRSIVEVLLAFSEPDDTLLDIGANLGYVSACLLNRIPGCKVVAVEPQPFIGNLLTGNLKQFGERQRVFPIALSDRDGEAWFFIDPDNKGKSRIVAPGFDGAQRIETRSAGDFLKDLNLGRLDLLKIDVEGHEETILRAAREQLRTLQPKIIVFEGNQRAEPTESAVATLLSEIGYAVYGLKKHLLRLSLEPLAAGNSASYNDYVAVSRSRRIPAAAKQAFPETALTSP